MVITQMEIVSVNNMEAKFNTTWDYLGYKDKNYKNLLDIQKDWNQTLITMVNLMSANIFQKTYRSGANLIKVNSEVFKIFKTMEFFSTNFETRQHKLSERYIIEIDDSLDNVVYVIRETEHDKMLREKNLIECYNQSFQQNNLSEIAFKIFVKDSEEHKKALENENNVFITDDCLVGKIEILNYNPEEEKVPHVKLKPIIDPKTGELSFSKEINMLPISRDIFLPSPDDKPVAIDLLPGAELDPVEDLKYLFDKYIKSIEAGKPNINFGSQLKQMIDKIAIQDSMVLRHNILDGSYKQKFVIPVGKLGGEKNH